MSDLWPPTIPPDVVNDTDQLDVHAQYHNDLAAGVSMLAARGFNLPSSGKLSFDTVERVVDALADALRGAP